MTETLAILKHLALLRWGPQPRDRAVLQARQQRRLGAFLARAAALSPFYRRRLRATASPLQDFPVLDKAAYLNHFAELNPQAIPLEAATAVALTAEQQRDFAPRLPGDLTVGLSSGTSGRRSVFLASAADRQRWAGEMLARTLSTGSLLRLFNPCAAPLRIAFFLRANSNLYTTLASRRLQLAYYDLTRPFDELLREMTAQKPHVIVAPATVLREIARRQQSQATGASPALRPRQLISVAEVLDPRDRRLIEETFGLPVAQVYQAAEGFLGASCPAGHIHLNEERLLIEPQWLDAKKERFQPLITDFSRQGQWFIRYHLQDILRVRKQPCPCGRHTLCLESVEGRAEEVLWLPYLSGDPGLAPVFPDALRQALYSLPRDFGLYRIEQHGLRWEVRLQDHDPELELAVQRALERLLNRLQLRAPEIVFLPWTDQPPEEKQRRIRCAQPPA